MEVALPRITHGDHCCLIFDEPEQQCHITASFLAIGLDRDRAAAIVAREVGHSRTDLLEWYVADTSGAAAAA